MKILMVSINSIHFERWTNQLINSGHEVYWFNIKDGAYSKNLSWVHQIRGWKQKFPNLKGRVFLKQKFPKIYKRLSVLIENKTETAFKSALHKIQPDVVHSFVLYLSCVPIFKVMEQSPKVKWIYSSWGSDLFYFQHQHNYLNDIKRVLPRINYLFTDCYRDRNLAEKYGFSGEFLGVFPGGGGYPIQEYTNLIKPVNARKKILIKGYQDRSGRANNVIDAIKNITHALSGYTIIVFAADKAVEDRIKTFNLQAKVDITIIKKTQFIPHHQLIKLMGEALIYIGNSNSDGMPNTLLEAIIMGAFPIQSNPGGATEEILKHNKNGLLIEDCEDSKHIAKQIENAIQNTNLIQNAFYINQKLKLSLDRASIGKSVVNKYNSIWK